MNRVETMPEGVELLAPGDDEILSPAALAFVARLHRELQTKLGRTRDKFMPIAMDEWNYWHRDYRLRNCCDGGEQDCSVHRQRQVYTRPTSCQILAAAPRPALRRAARNATKSPLRVSTGSGLVIVPLVGDEGLKSRYTRSTRLERLDVGEHLLKFGVQVRVAVEP